MADSRRARRTRGKSDSIDALAVARAALREGIDTLPAAQLDGPELDLRLLVDHRERLVRQRVALNNTLQWHLHDLWPELELPGRLAVLGQVEPRIARRLARAEQTMRVRIARDELRRIRELTAAIKALETEIAAARRRDRAAAALRARVRAADRGQARRRDRRRRPLRHRRQARPRRPGSRRSRSAPARPTATASTAAATARSTPRIHRIAITRARCHPETRDYIARKLAEGKTTPRSHPLPQAPPRPPHLAPAPTARAHPEPDDHTHFFDIGAAIGAAAEASIHRRDSKLRRATITRLSRREVRILDSAVSRMAKDETSRESWLSRRRVSDNERLAATGRACPCTS